MRDIQAIQSQNFFRLDGTLCPSRDLDMDPGSACLHVLDVELGNSLPNARALLSLEEQRRADRFLFERDRLRFIESHALTRMFVAAFLRCAPDALIIETTAEGKPFLAKSHGDLHFNLSHTSDRALIALAFGQEIGVDVEKHRTMKCMELAEHFFAPGEVVQLLATAHEEQQAAFFRCWTRKEALVKALGRGLLFPLNQFEVSVQPSSSTQLLSEHSFERFEGFRVVDFPMRPGYSAAVAGSANPWTIIAWELDS